MHIAEINLQNIIKFINVSNDILNLLQCGSHMVLKRENQIGS